MSSVYLLFIKFCFTVISPISIPRSNPQASSPQINRAISVAQDHGKGQALSPPASVAWQYAVSSNDQ